ncbi:hypothetical protein M0802_006961 [Mischocyttarus mexicanus]|nr:hypothetical protein M0802_006961 [Mischocyttarus mexicanus]
MTSDETGSLIPNGLTKQILTSGNAVRGAFALDALRSSTTRLPELLRTRQSACKNQTRQDRTIPDQIRQDITYMHAILSKVSTFA